MFKNCFLNLRAEVKNQCNSLNYRGIKLYSEGNNSSNTNGEMTTKIGKHTLSSKLNKERVAKLRQAEAANVLPDIEDAAINVQVTKSQYFSPLQTRQQRKNNNSNQPTNLEVPRATKRMVTKKIEKQLQSVKSLHNVGEAITTDSAEQKVSILSEVSVVQPELNVADCKIVATSQWEPLHWKQMLENIRQMRLDVSAPVDTMGCHKCSDDAADEKTQRYHKLVALMLSSQTKDETTYEGMQRLRAQGLNPQNIVSMPTAKLEELLRPISFYKNKAKYLQQTARILLDKYDADIPNNIKELVALPGVGPKMAHICMATAWNEITGIGVDVHVHRISNRLRWLPKETKEPEQTRIGLEAWLPRSLWAEVNHLLVGFGQTICTPVRPHCSDCLNQYICPAADKTAVKKKTKAAPLSQQQPDLSPTKKPKVQNR